MAVNITNRADAEAIIREQVVSSIFQDAPKIPYLWEWQENFQT